MINEISSTGVNKIDADIKIQPIKKTDSYLSDAWVPDDLNKFNGYSVYTRDIGKSKYDNLNCYVYYFSNENDERNIRVAFSGKGKPIRYYGFDSDSALNSTINNNELVIYKYENIYFVEFIYNNVNYDIETDGINIVELEMFLKSIIKYECVIKKKVLIGLIIIVLVILLFPRRNTLNNGGTIEYKSVVYKVSKVHRYKIDGKYNNNFENGIIIELFGKEIYNNVE